METQSSRKNANGTVRRPRNRLHAFYRGTLFNAIIIGLVSFTQPGIWGALSNLGAGGLATPFFVNAANVITFAIMIFMSPIFAILSNRWSLKWVLVFGTLGYAPYSASLYTNSVYGMEWFMLFGAATCGFSAAALWVSEAAIGTGYPELRRQGVFLAIWFALNKIGSIVATSIQLALNLDDSEKGSISPKTYLVLISLQCLGLPLSLLISPVDKLIRTDGTKPTRPARVTFVEGFVRFWRICKRPEIAALVPIFLTSQWGQTYEGNYLTTYFTVRARALAAFVITWVGLIINIFFGWLLDSKYIVGKKRSTRARVGWIILVASYTATYIYQIVVQVQFQNSTTVSTFDIHSPEYARAVAVYCLYFVPYNAFSVWGYWVLGSIDKDIENITYSTALLRSSESLASTISYALGASKHISLLTNLLVAAVLFWVSVPITTWGVWRVGDLVEEKEEKEEEGLIGGDEAGGLVVTVDAVDTADGGVVERIRTATKNNA